MLHICLCISMDIPWVFWEKSLIPHCVFIQSIVTGYGVASNEMHFKLERTSHTASWCLLRCLCCEWRNAHTHTHTHARTHTHTHAHTHTDTHTHRHTHTRTRAHAQTHKSSSSSPSVPTITHKPLEQKEISSQWWRAAVGVWVTAGVNPGFFTTL